MSYPFLDSVTVCLGAISALRASLCVEQSFRQTSFPSFDLGLQPWQLHALSTASGVATVLYAWAGGSREALVANVLILTAGSCVPLLHHFESEGVDQ